MKKTLSFLIMLLAIATSASAQGASAVVHSVKDGIAGYSAVHGMLGAVPQPPAITFVAMGAIGLVLVMKRYK
jgi:hypothetical protein